MKHKKFLDGFFFLFIVLVFLVIQSGCKSETSNQTETPQNINQENPPVTQNTKPDAATDESPAYSDTEQSRSENWLLGTWEAVVPGDAEAPFANITIRMNVTSVQLAKENKPAGIQTHRVYVYFGSFVWGADGQQFTMPFDDKEFVEHQGGNVVIWECTTFKPSKQFTEHISIAARDAAGTHPSHSISLNWGPTIVTASSNNTYLDFYGDLEIHNGGRERADFKPPQMLRFTKL
ncbi:MAG: hypothetical protein V1720_13100 [bacterium]